MVNKKMLILLDVDGVLNLHSDTYDTSHNANLAYNAIEYHLMSRLENLISYLGPEKVNIVVSSAWSKSELISSFTKLGFPYISCIKDETGRSGKHKGDNVIEYLDWYKEENNVNEVNYVVIEDSYHDLHKYIPEDTIIPVDCKIGFSDDNVFKCIKTLTGKEANKDNFFNEIHKAKKSNLFIAIEGCDGCGKSTQVNLLSKLSHTYVYEQINNDSDTGSFLRRILSGKDSSLYKNKYYTAMIVGMFALKREFKFKDPMIGAKSKKYRFNNIITDRYFYSTLAYTYEKDKELFDLMLSVSKMQERPDIVFYLDTSLENISKRISKRNEHTEVFETIEKIKKVKSGYEYITTLFPEIVPINGNQSPEQIHFDILNEIANKRETLNK